MMMRMKFPRKDTCVWCKQKKSVLLPYFFSCLLSVASHYLLIGKIKSEIGDSADGEHTNPHHPSSSS